MRSPQGATAGAGAGPAEAVTPQQGSAGSWLLLSMVPALWGEVSQTLPLLNPDEKCSFINSSSAFEERERKTLS